MIYLAEVGSKSHNINIESSDQDILCVNLFYNINIPNNNDCKIDFIKMDKMGFFNTIMFKTLNAYGIQCLCPSKFYVYNDISKFIIDNRDNFIRNIEASFYNNIMQNTRIVDNIHKNIISVYNNPMNYTKPLAYSITLLSILKKYNFTKSITESSILDSATLEFVKNIRRKKIDYTDSKKLYDNLRSDALRFRDNFKANNESNSRLFIKELSDLFKIPCKYDHIDDETFKKLINI